MIRTLIVDDDVRVAEIHCGYVAKVGGFEVVGVAHRGTEALRRVLEDEPDLILLDIYLPDLGGLEVCRRLRAAGNLTDVIAVTAARDVDTVRSAVGLGVAPGRDRRHARRAAVEPLAAAAEGPVQGDAGPRQAHAPGRGDAARRAGGR
jgi:CheY-like chemotaxis protein